MTLDIVSGAATAQLVGYEDAIAAIRDMFVAYEAGQSVVFPAIQGRGSDKTTRFGVKAGYDGTHHLPGLKVGSYWPMNAARGLPNHGSTTLLLDDATGFPVALVEATWLNALRTAASDADAVDMLARRDAGVLAVIGSGNQAYHEMRAVALVRPPEAILVCARTAEKADNLVKTIAPRRAERACRDDRAGAGERRRHRHRDRRARCAVRGACGAGRDACFRDGRRRPGETGIAAGPGVAGFFVRRRARAIDRARRVSISRRHARRAAYRRDRHRVERLERGREDDAAITIYDSSGIGLQDIAIAALALDRARAAGLVTKVEF